MIEKVKSGQRITASHINRIASSADAAIYANGMLANRIQDGGINLAPINPLQGGVKGVVVQAFNVADFDFAPLDVVVISGRPSLIENIRETIVAIDIPLISNLDFMAVALDDIPVGQMGRIIISGVCYVKTDGGAGSHGTPAAGDTELAVGAGGLAQIIYNNTTDKIALIRFPVGGSGGDATHWQFVWNEGPDL